MVYDKSRPISVSKKKYEYQETLLKCFREYKKALIINVDFVGSNSLQLIRKDLRGKARILMGKNTVIRKVLKLEEKFNPGFTAVLPHIKGNIGLVFTNGDLLELRDKIVADSQVPAAAKQGAVAPIDVHLEPGPTGLDPGQTSFFQAMNIQTKINRGSIEIIGRSRLVVKGEKVSASAAVLLSKLNQKPFTYSIQVMAVYEQESCYSAAVLDLTEEEIERKFLTGLAHASSVSLGLSYPSMASIPHLLSNALRKVIAFCVETDYDIKYAEPYKKFLANPEAFIVAAPTVDGGDTAQGTAAKEDEEEESDGEALDLFD